MQELPTKQCAILRYLHREIPGLPSSSIWAFCVAAMISL